MVEGHLRDVIKIQYLPLIMSLMEHDQKCHAQQMLAYLMERFCPNLPIHGCCCKPEFVEMFGLHLIWLSRKYYKDCMHLVIFQCIEWGNDYHDLVAHLIHQKGHCKQVCLAGTSSCNHNSIQSQ